MSDKRPAAGSDIVPFHVPVDAEALADLRERLARTRWPDRETVDGWDQGVPLDYLQALCRYWEQDYDWSARAEAINQLPQFTTVLDGVRIHFVHAPSPEPHAVPLLITHGWPGSYLDFIDVVAPLSDPRAHGGDPADAFHVVCA
ncbi:epoxide hydrolase N-terminal domain-containing protein, partial [Streptomyces sp. NPDC059083]|uniref:epoxide hydrolase N-terminal domain-containing protein n=1 Tax=Streptomyces sp. NPDC059083 TaxID=3346721 RepID=UPI0036AACFE8